MMLIYFFGIKALIEDFKSTWNKNKIIGVLLGLPFLILIILALIIDILLLIPTVIVNKLYERYYREKGENKKNKNL